MIIVCTTYWAALSEPLISGRIEKNWLILKFRVEWNWSLLYKCIHLFTTAAWWTTLTNKRIWLACGKCGRVRNTCPSALFWTFKILFLSYLSNKIYVQMDHTIHKIFPLYFCSMKWWHLYIKDNSGKYSKLWTLKHIETMLLVGTYSRLFIILDDDAASIHQIHILFLDQSICFIRIHIQCIVFRSVWSRLLDFCHRRIWITA